MRSSTPPGPRASSGWCAWAPISPPRGRPWPIADAPARRRARPSASIRTTPSGSATSGPSLVGAGRATRASSRSASAGSTTTTSTRPGPDQAEAFRAQIRLAHELDRTLVIHTREAWDETFAILDDEGVPAAHRLPLLHRWPRRGAGAVSTAAPRCRSAGSSRSRTPTTSAPPPRSRRATGCSSRPTAPTSPRSRTAGSRTGRPGSGRSGRVWRPPALNP